MTRTIAIFGASGLVGATVVERLLADGQYDVRPIIHTAGNAWRLARRGQPFQQADLCDFRAVQAALEGCTHVINCTRGTNRTMIKGMKTLLQACKEQKIRRLVHLSSVLVYGEPPSPESIREEAVPQCERGTYAWYKLRQDNMVKEAARKGLSTAVLCIPNVSGIYSSYLLEVLASLRSGTFALVDEGMHPVVLGDVANIAYAVERALTPHGVDGTRIFIHDGEETTWRDLAEALMPLAERTNPLPSVSRQEAERLLHGEGRGLSATLKTFKQAASLEEVKEIVKQNPTLSRTFRSWRARFESLPAWPRNKISALLVSKGGRAQSSSGHYGSYERRLIRHQLRGVRHSIDKARRILDYNPPYSFEASMRAFEAWYRTSHGFDTPAWSLWRELYQ